MREAIESKSEAKEEFDRIRTAIRESRYQSASSPQTTLDDLSFAQFSKVWEERRGRELANAYDNKHRLKKVCAFRFPGETASMTFGQKPLASITTDDIEAYRDHRKAQELSPVTVNHDLRLLRKMFNWGIRKGYLEATPFKRGTVTVIQLERETARSRRFQVEDDENKLLEASSEHLHGVLVALLDTACRPGEILSLQWRDVNMERRELTVQAAKSKTRTGRIIPISSRPMSVLEMRRLDPAGQPHGSKAYVFGDAIGRRTKSARSAWNRAREAASLGDLQLRDLRHEAGSRFAEAGMPINYVSGMLGHSNLTTTSRYLNINRRELHRAMQRFEASRAEFAQSLHKADEESQAVVQSPNDPAVSNSQKNLD